MWDMVSAWAYGLIALVVSWAFIVPLLMSRRRYVTFEERTGVCSGCGYSLVGLPEASRCPECGLASPEKIVRHGQGELEFHGFRAQMLASLVPLVLAIPPLVPFAWYAAWRWHGWSHRAVVRLVLWKEQDYTESVTTSMAAMALAAPLVVCLLRSERRGARRWGIAGAHAGAFTGLILGALTIWGSFTLELAIAGMWAAVGMIAGAVTAVFLRRLMRR